MMDRFEHPRGRRWASCPGLWCPGLLLLVLACNESPDRPPPAKSETDIELTDLISYDTSTADARDVYAKGVCTDGATRQCRVYLPSHNDVQPCFVGEQACLGSEWGECGSGTVVDANADDSQIEPDDLPE